MAEDDPKWEAGLELLNRRATGSAESWFLEGSEGRVIRLLQSSPVLEAQLIPGSTAGAMVFLLESGDKAVFRAGGYEELAAYRLSRLLRLGYVPPVTEFRYRGVDGTLQLFVGGKEGFEWGDPTLRPWDVDEVDRVDRVNAQAFDFLIAQGDRHGGNWLLRTWTEGGRRRSRLILFDHEASFFELWNTPVQPLAEEQLAEIKGVGAAFLERLEAVSPAQIQDALRSIHDRRDPENLAGVLRNRRRLLRHLERLRLDSQRPKIEESRDPRVRARQRLRRLFRQIGRVRPAPTRRLARRGGTPSARGARWQSDRRRAGSPGILGNLRWSRVGRVRHETSRSLRR